MKEEIKEEIIEYDLNFESDLCIESNDIRIKTETISECEYTKRNGWHCYPIDDNDPKLHQKTLVVLDKLQPSFDNMCFQDCDKNSKTDDKEENIDSADNENSELTQFYLEIQLKEEEEQYFETDTKENTSLVKGSQSDHVCETCDRSFTNKECLQAHILRNHTREKSYSCVFCSKSFRRKYILKKHIRTHTGEKPYTCEVCRKSFSQTSTLKQHIRTHTGEKPHTCEVCKKKFRIFNHFKLHLRTHTGEKPYTCEVCRKSFSQTSTLKKHIRTHTGEKPYTCEVCRKSFSQISNLKSHLRTHCLPQI